MIYKPEFADQARAMCRLGATDEELAEHFGACVRTIYRWRNTHEEFAEAVIVGKDHADARVERALYARAVGCVVERTKVFKHAGDTDPVYATYQHHLPPDPVAALQWLRVRQPEKWGIPEEPDEEDEQGRIILEAFARRDERLRAEDEARLAEQAGRSEPMPPQQPGQPEQQPSQQPGQPSPSPNAAAPGPDPALDTDMARRLDDDPAPEPCSGPEEDRHPAPAAEPAPPPPPPPPSAPKTVMPPCDFPFGSRGQGGYGWSPPDPGG